MTSLASLVVPPALVVRLAALTVLPNVVVPVLFAMRVPSPVVPPTAPVKSIFPAPLSTVKA